MKNRYQDLFDINRLGLTTQPRIHQPGASILSESFQSPKPTN